MAKKNQQKGISRHTKLYDTDGTAKNIWLSLVRDFRNSEGSEFARNAEKAFLGGISNFRDYSFPELGIISPGRFKRYKQLEGLLKKYRFADDKFTDEELEIKTLEKFLQEQEIFALYKPRTELVHRVLQRARFHARSILGKYDPEYTVTAGRFGKKSSIGCPLNLAYIDHKLASVKAFTGSSECSKWFFEHVVPGDPILQELINKLPLKDSPGLEHESLNLVNVPKSWKTYRPITPLTLLSLFYSYGVAEQVTNRLKDIGLDLSRLQSQHREKVKENSVTRKSATADLSSASQSLLSDLLNSILPREWYNAIKKTFSHQLCYTDGEDRTVTFYTESVLPMGNGLTFPVETLVFYVVLKAIAELSGVRGAISVYGDDLIYPSVLHKYVAVIFPQLKFMLNLDKTFVKAPFRESCGSDYYRGCDVRPAFLPGQHCMLTRTKYAVWLYKCYNSLVRRWDELEIRGTLQLILVELATLMLPLYTVPPSFPDTAGIKVSSPGMIPLDTTLLPWSPVKTCFSHGSIWHTFSYLTVEPDRRVVKNVLPYYWLALQGLDDEPEPNFWTQVNFRRNTPCTPLNWSTVKRERVVKTSDGKVVKRFVQKSTLVTSSARSGSRVKVTTNLLKGRFGEAGSISDWF